LAYRITESCIGCTACTRRCPTNAISGERNKIHYIDPDLCIDCGACGVVCPPEASAIIDNEGDVCMHFSRKDELWPKAVVDEELCIGSGCEQCINVCPFDALSLDRSGQRVGDFFGVAVVDERKCTGCRLCESVCGWDAIHIYPERTLLKKKLYEREEAAVH